MKSFFETLYDVGDTRLYHVTLNEISDLGDIYGYIVPELKELGFLAWEWRDVDQISFLGSKKKMTMFLLKSQNRFRFRESPDPNPMHHSRTVRI